MLDTLAVVCAELDAARTQRRKALITLQAKKQQIEQFSKTTVSWIKVFKKANLGEPDPLHAWMLGDPTLV